MNIKKVVIIGSGTMGSGIAAQVANAGISAVLLDLPSKEGSRNQITENAKARILKSRPPLLVEKSKNGILFGYTDNYIKTRIQGHISLENTIQNVFISEAKSGYVESEVVSIN